MLNAERITGISYLTWLVVEALGADAAMAIIADVDSITAVITQVDSIAISSGRGEIPERGREACLGRSWVHDDDDGMPAEPPARDVYGRAPGPLRLGKSQRLSEPQRARALHLFRGHGDYKGL